MFYLLRSPAGKAKILLGDLDNINAALSAATKDPDRDSQAVANDLVRMLDDLEVLEERAQKIKGFVVSLPAGSLNPLPASPGNGTDIPVWNRDAQDVIVAHVQAYKHNLQGLINRLEEGAKKSPWFRWLAGCLGLPILAALFIAFAVYWLYPSAPVSEGAGTSAATTASAPAETAPAAPAPAAAEDPALDCTKAEVARKDGSAWLVIPIRQLQGAVWIKDGTVVDGACKSQNGTPITPEAFNAIRRGLATSLDPRLGAKLSDPVTVGSFTVRCYVPTEGTAGCGPE